MTDIHYPENLIATHYKYFNGDTFLGTFQKAMNLQTTPGHQFLDECLGNICFEYTAHIPQSKNFGIFMQYLLTRPLTTIEKFAKNHYVLSTAEHQHLPNIAAWALTLPHYKGFELFLKLHTPGNNYTTSDFNILAQIGKTANQCRLLSNKAIYLSETGDFLTQVAARNILKPQEWPILLGEVKHVQNFLDKCSKTSKVQALPQTLALLVEKARLHMALEELPEVNLIKPIDKVKTKGETRILKI